MEFEMLNQNNAGDYITYLKLAMSEEPDKMTAEIIDGQGIRNRISDPFFKIQHRFWQGKMEKSGGGAMLPF